MRNLDLLTAFLALVAPANSHSWIEGAHRIAPNGTIILGVTENPPTEIPGLYGFPRGPNSFGKPRVDNTHRLPTDPRPFYTAEDTLTDLPQETENLLQASPGDWIALRHTENGHVTKLAPNPYKPLNRGNIYIYGTHKPKTPERLLDVHLQWNKDGTGGDKRGRLIATRNYDDGQCFEANNGAPSELWHERSKDVGSQQPLACQSDIQLPDDLSVGEIYTIYWYWDWPDLDGEKLDMKQTAKGLFPWGGDQNMAARGWTEDMIKKNESYSSTIDIMITDKFRKGGFMMKDGSEYDESADVYHRAIKSQLNGNFAVDVNVGNPSKGDQKNPGDLPKPKPEQPVEEGEGNGNGNGDAQDGGDGAGNSEIVTVSVTVSVSPSPIMKTVTVTASPTNPAVPGSITATATAPPDAAQTPISPPSMGISPPKLPKEIIRPEDEGNNAPPPAQIKRSALSTRRFAKRQYAGSGTIPPFNEEEEKTRLKLQEQNNKGEKERVKGDAEEMEKWEGIKQKLRFGSPFVIGGGARRPMW